MSRVLEMTDFVPAESIDPRYFDSPYYLVPQKGGEKAYALLRDALAETSKVGIGTFALRQKQHLAAVKPMGEALVLELMRFETELVDPGDLKLPSAADAYTPLGDDRPLFELDQPTIFSAISRCSSREQVKTRCRG